MSLLPAVVPDIPEKRSRVVAARLARRVGPLFGVGWDGAPHGLSWVCDYTATTLAEIGRGAPLPRRPIGNTDSDTIGDSTCTDDQDSRAVPNEHHPGTGELAHATLHRFGPDTKAAVVLTGANRLLEPVTEGVGAALAVLQRTDPMMPTRLKLAAWAAMVLEAFRSQPALLIAAITARQIQRAALTRWELPAPRDTHGWSFARCEIGAPRPVTWQAGSPTSPITVDVAETTVRDIDLPAATPPTTVTALAERWLARLAAMGTELGDGYLWLDERTPGRRVVQAYIPQTPAVAAYLHDIDPLLLAEPDPPRLPAIPTPDAVTGLDRAARRALVLGLTTVIRQVRADPRAREATRPALPPALDALTHLAETALGRDDPLTLVTRCRAADIRVHTLRHDLDNDLSGPLRALRRELAAARRAHDAGVLDRGLLAELLYSGSVEINVVRRVNAHHPASGLPAPATLNRALRDLWPAFLTAVDITPDTLRAEPSARARRAGFHLSAYASFLASQDRDADLLAAAELFDHTVLPARRQHAAHTGWFEPLRQSLQTATRATTRLATRHAARGDLEQARRWAALGRDWAHTALDHPHTRALLAAGGEAAAHLALLAAPALLTAIDLDIAPHDTVRDLTTTQDLLRVAQNFAATVTGHHPHEYVRAGEITAIADHVATITAALSVHQQP